MDKVLSTIQKGGEGKVKEEEKIKEKRNRR